MSATKYSYTIESSSHTDSEFLHDQLSFVEFGLDGYPNKTTQLKFQSDDATLFPAKRVSTTHILLFYHTTDLKNITSLLKRNYTLADGSFVDTENNTYGFFQMNFKRPPQTFLDKPNEKSEGSSEAFTVEQYICLFHSNGSGSPTNESRVTIIALGQNKVCKIKFQEDSNPLPPPEKIDEITSMFYFYYQDFEKIMNLLSHKGILRCFIDDSLIPVRGGFNLFDIDVNN